MTPQVAATVARCAVLLALATGAAAGNRDATALGGHSGTLWPNPLSIPYEIDPSMSQSDSRIAFALQHWEQKTCIRFKKRTNEREFLRFTAHRSACSSYVGMVRGGNRINLARGCDRGAVVHEIGHALGLTHEQSRTDRDRYVTVHFDQIQPSTRNNFEKSARVNVGEYDYGSIMHYSSRAFAVGRRPTITAPQPIGQRRGLSPGDAATVDFLYMGCAAPSQIAAPRCIATMDTGRVHTVAAGSPVEVMFAGRYTSSLSVTAFRDGTRLGSAGNGRSTATITARATPASGATTVLKATFTGRDGRSASCSVTLRGSGGGSPPSPSPSSPSPSSPTPSPPTTRPRCSEGRVCDARACYSCIDLIDYLVSIGFSRAAAAARVRGQYPDQCGACSGTGGPAQPTPAPPTPAPPTPAPPTPAPPTPAPLTPTTAPAPVGPRPVWGAAYFRGTPNNWKVTAMTFVNGFWVTTQSFGASDPRFKIDRRGDWAESYPSENYRITQGAGRYEIKFNDRTKRITVEKKDGARRWAAAYFRGTPNNWKVTAMTFSGGLWRTTQRFQSGGNPRFKVDRFGDWKESYPSNDYRVTQGSGDYAITFSDATGKVTATKLA